MFKKLVIIVLILFTIISFALASQNEMFLSRGKAGKAASFLNSRFDPYGVSTGAAIVSFASTIESIFWNPAGLSGIESPELALSGSEFSFNRYFSYVSFAMPVGENRDKALGFSLLSSYVGDIASYSEDDVRGGNYYYWGNSFIFTYSQPMDLLKFGFNVKVVNELVEKSTAFGGALDIGLIVTPPLPIRLGISIQNGFPGVMKWQDESKVQTMGSSYLLSIGYISFNGDTKMGITFLKDSDSEDFNTNLGGEFTFSFISIRLGFLKGSFSGGLGLDFSVARVNYAFYDDSFLDMSPGSHLISTVISF
ncbi:MAG: hypothetical protein JW827_05265 [Spirochaetes bacterium]|nr:hypothetical protein [Spirochaetota bacterium]